MDHVKGATTHFILYIGIILKESLLNSLPGLNPDLTEFLFSFIKSFFQLTVVFLCLPIKRSTSL